MKDFLLQKKQFVFYCLIGFSGAGLHTLTYCCLVRSGILTVQPAYAIGYASGTLLSFFLNARYNFETGDKTLLRLVSFFSVAFLGWGVSAALLYLLVNQLAINKILALFPTILFVALLQYNLNRLISFRKS